MAKPKRKNPADHRNAAKSLTTAEIFFIENNPTMSVEEIAKALAKPVDLIQAFTADWNAKHPPVKDKPRALKMMQRQHGTVGMTEASSMVGDDARSRGNRDLEAIAFAERAGNTELADQLRQEYEEKKRLKRQEKARNKFNQIVHFIVPPDDLT